jgi:hypothetical protein
VYVWNTTLLQFNIFQQIPTNGSYHSRFFTINGSHYLVIAQYQSALFLYNTFSVVYRYNVTGRQFSLFQRLPTSGATFVAPFTMNYDTYLAVACNNNGNTALISSNIWMFNNGTGLFVNYQDVSTQSAASIEAFGMSATTYLAIANFIGNSVVMVYSAATSKFVLYQNLSTLSCSHLKPFILGAKQYLAAANNAAEIFVWTNETAKFQSFQTILSPGAYSIEYFEISNRPYLFIGNGSTDATRSTVFEFSLTSSQFSVFQYIPTNACWFSKAFQLGSDVYLAVANHNLRATYKLNSKVYKWCTSEFDVS